MKRLWSQGAWRMAVGGCVGVILLTLLGGVCNDLVSGGLIAMGPHTPFRLVSADLTLRVGSKPLALVLQSLLYFALGAVAGLATLPFADNGRSLILRSLAHFAATAALLSLTTWLQGWAWNLSALLWYLVLLAVVYLLIWLARWVGWYGEVVDLRTQLGLDPGPSPLKWKESLPYLAFALGLCGLLPHVLRLLDPTDVPLLTGLLLPCLLYPVGGLFSGLSLGRRHGLCLLYPAVGTLLCLGNVFLLYNASALFHCALFGLPALIGNILGALWQKKNAEHNAGKEDLP